LAAVSYVELWIKIAGYVVKMRNKKVKGTGRTEKWINKKDGFDLCLF
jgi:hypothetical protein